MMLQIQTFVLGPIENNSYLIFDDKTRSALVIDPALEPAQLITFIQKNSLQPEKVLITHAHFDHYYGLLFLTKTFPSITQIYLHPDDLDLWRSGGGARDFFGDVISVSDPNTLITSDDKVLLGTHQFTIRHTPGHSPGSVIYYSSELKSAFCGDLIFYHGVGRTDLAGGNEGQLLHSIQTQVFTLPDETTLYPGHGPSTSVAEEKLNNPFV
ncbi:MAG: MBL fold metallo-hydrolase [Anaerolineaceae bacterium]